MEQVVQLLALFGLDPALAGTALALGVILRYARGTLHWMTSELTYLAALLLGAFGAWLRMAEGQPLRETAGTATALACVVLIMQKLLELLAAKVGFLPKDGEWTVTNKGGTP
jgi:hypothetical protein